jgi:hypothetical protein
VHLGHMLRALMSKKKKNNTAHLGIFWKSVERIQVSLISYKSNGYFTSGAYASGPMSKKKNIVHLGIFLKSFERIQVSLNCYKGNGYFNLRPVYICENISLNSS